jgi:hypothetical protein
MVEAELGHGLWMMVNTEKKKGWGLIFLRLTVLGRRVEKQLGFHCDSESWAPSHVLRLRPAQGHLGPFVGYMFPRQSMAEMQGRTPRSLVGGQGAANGERRWGWTGLTLCESQNELVMEILVFLFSEGWTKRNFRELSNSPTRSPTSSSPNRATLISPV